MQTLEIVPEGRPHRDRVNPTSFETESAKTGGSVSQNAGVPREWRDQGFTLNLARPVTEDRRSPALIAEIDEIL